MNVDEILEKLMVLIGAEIAKMHKGDIIHGDLTTSNMMLRRIQGEQEARLVSKPIDPRFLLIDLSRLGPY